MFDEVYCPKENTFRFLEDVLTEVMDLFPSHYIHIGGDECPKKAWKKCAHCQALMKREGLPDEEALQSWFIHRIEQFVNSRGRDIIGWDEILQGGLAPNATVMSWRGEEGGIEAARQKHKVIMTPGVHCYFDFYQAVPEQQPMAMRGTADGHAGILALGHRLCLQSPACGLDTGRTSLHHWYASQCLGRIYPNFSTL